MSDKQPFAGLTPELIMDAVESIDLRCDCRTFPLNSYENRVYQVGIEDAEPLVAKFYRPERWSDAQIEEEHQFCFELAAQELPVVAPWCDEAGESLFHYHGFRFSLYPRRGGRLPELDNLDNLKILGRLLARIHRVGSARPFTTRPTLSPESFGHQAVTFLLGDFVPQDYRQSYRLLADQLLGMIEEIFARVPHQTIRTHGDCHSGNMLWREENPNFVDFDDARSAPAIQDLWMLLCGDRPRQQAQLEALLDGYRQFHDFNPAELQLVEALRSLRLLHYSAWLARRWDDPAFPVAFPWFNTIQYWGEQILMLREQIAALQEPPLQL